MNKFRISSPSIRLPEKDAKRKRMKKSFWAMPSVIKISRCGSLALAEPFDPRVGLHYD